LGDEGLAPVPPRGTARERRGEAGEGTGGGGERPAAGLVAARVRE